MSAKRRSISSKTTDHACGICRIRERTVDLGIDVSLYQSDQEGDIVACIRQVMGQADAIVISSAACMHSSIVTLDALEAVQMEADMVRIRDMLQRRSSG